MKSTVENKESEREKLTVDLNKLKKRELIDLFEWSIDATNDYANRVLKNEVKSSLYPLIVLAIISLGFFFENLINGGWIMSIIWTFTTVAWSWMAFGKYKFLKKIGEKDG